MKFSEKLDFNSLLFACNALIIRFYLLFDYIFIIMRILLGCLDYIDKTYYKEALKNYDLKIFSYANADIEYDPGNVDFPTILTRLPAGWEPDLVMFFHPEYQFLPIGMEECPYPLIALVSDWNLGFESINNIIGCFDYVFIDKKGVDVFKNAGFNNIEFSPLYAYSPAHHKRYRNIEKLYDISMIGNLNHKVQKERSKWIKRLSLLSSKYRIGVISNIYGEDYVRLLNQSKITFNRSIRGEMNMRAYEAPACGSLLFYEEGNGEIEDILQNGIHCVLYNENNFEDLLDYYLTHDDEREQIIDNAYDKIAIYSYEYQLKNIINRVNDIGLDKLKQNKRLVENKTIVQQHNDRAIHAYYTGVGRALSPAKELLNKAMEIMPDNPELFNNLGVIFLELIDIVFFNANEEQQELSSCLDQEYMKKLINNSINALNKAIEIYPEYALAHLNLSSAHVFGKNKDKAIEELNLVIDLLTKDYKKALKYHGIYYPYSYNDFKREWEQSFIQYNQNIEKLNERLRELILGKAYELLGDLYQSEGSSLKALEAYDNSLNWSINGEIFHYIGNIHRLSGNKDKAYENLYNAIKTSPFEMDAYMELIGLILQDKNVKALVPLVNELLTLTNTCPKYKKIFQYIMENLFSKITKQKGFNIKFLTDETLAKTFFNLYDPDIESIKLEDIKDFNFLYLWNESSPNWKILLKSYINTFKSNNNVALIILFERLLYDKEYVQDVIASYIQNELNIDMDNIPDIVILDGSVLLPDNSNILKSGTVFIHTPDIIDVWYLGAISLQLPVIGNIEVYDNEYEALKSIYTIPGVFTENDISVAMKSIYSDLDSYTQNLPKGREVVMKRYEKTIEYIVNDYFYRLIKMVN